MLPVIFVQDLLARLVFDKPFPPLFAPFGTTAVVAAGFVEVSEAIGVEAGIIYA